MVGRTPDGWSRVDAVFARALDLSTGERQRYLAAACTLDPHMRPEVDALLAASRACDGFFKVLNVRDAPILGRRVGPYRLLERVGRGGMGAVYVAERVDSACHERVAVKMPRRRFGDEVAARRFGLERAILERVHHPNIAQLLDGGVTADGQPYVVLEYVVGESLTEYADRRRLDVRRRLTMLCTVCAAVHHAHLQRVVHRDLKPANILVRADGVVKLLDFGIARVLDAAAFGLSTPVTQRGVRVLSPDYAAPEQVRGDAITPATDVYALGVLLYEVLTGRRPYSLGRGLKNLERVICEEMPPPPSEVIRSDATSGEELAARCRARRASPARLERRLRGELDAIVLRALQKEPARRFGSVAELAGALRRWERQQSWPARLYGVLHHARRCARRCVTDAQTSSGASS